MERLAAALSLPLFLLSSLVLPHSHLLVLSLSLSLSFLIHLHISITQYIHFSYTLSAISDTSTTIWENQTRNQGSGLKPPFFQQWSSSSLSYSLFAHVFLSLPLPHAKRCVSRFLPFILSLFLGVVVRQEFPIKFEMKKKEIPNEMSFVFISFVFGAFYSQLRAFNWQVRTTPTTEQKDTSVSVPFLLLSLSLSLSLVFNSLFSSFLFSSFLFPYFIFSFSPSLQFFSFTFPPQKQPKHFDFSFPLSLFSLSLSLPLSLFPFNCQLSNYISLFDSHSVPFLGFFTLPDFWERGEWETRKWKRASFFLFFERCLWNCNSRKLTFIWLRFSFFASSSFHLHLWIPSSSFRYSPSFSSSSFFSSSLN